MALKDALAMLEGKLVLGEYGPQTRPFVVLDIDEYQILIRELKTISKRRKVPSETSRQTNATL